MDIEARVREFFGPGGVLSRAHAAFESRPPQLAMALDVCRTLREGGHLVVEAGTGIGKTLAYLVPAVLARRRVIVSTGTRALQDQLARKDVPFLTDRCGLRFRAAVLKGRDNYLCRYRFEAVAQQQSLRAGSAAATWPRVVEWARHTTVGDVAELTELPENPEFWPDVNARSATCLGSRCPDHSQCHLQEVRRIAHDADVIIVNHHLYLADAVVRGSPFGTILPDADVAVFDEAHRLEDAATSFFGRTVSGARLRELADDMLRELARAGVAPPGPVVQRATQLLAAAAAFSRPWGPPSGRRPLPTTLPPAQEDALSDALHAVRSVRAALDAWRSAPAAAEPFLRRAVEIEADLDAVMRRDDPTSVSWYEVKGRTAFVGATPVDLSQRLRESVFARLQASVLCSATLATGGSMTHVRARLGLGRAESGDTELLVREAVHPSPFDHASQGLLHASNDLPDPRDPGFAAACADRIAELVDASRGRAFLLFTSFENMRRVHALLEGRLEWPVLVQGEAPKQELLRRFQQEQGSVLFATHSFWEGVDVPGSALSLVVIDKLPFAAPSDPLVAARSRLVEEAGGNPFLDLAVPEAVLALKQGVGRLIRSHADRGVIALLDPRVMTTRYGARFLDDLPPFRHTTKLSDVRHFFAADP